MAKVIIPTIFKAVDKYSTPLSRMTKTTRAFSDTASSAIGRSERAFRKFTPGLSDATKQMLGFASTGAIVAGAIGGINFTFNALKEYEKGLASLSAITGVTGEAFDAFKAEVDAVAKDTKKAGVDVAKAFEIAGSAKPELLKSADALGEVAKQGIILSKASGEDVETSIKSLTGTMNQFNLGADQSLRVINTLAAGSKAGAAAVPLISEAMDKFGTVAASMNVSVEESVGLIETLAEKNIMGAEAGTKLRNVLTKMATAKALPKEALTRLTAAGVNLDVVSDKSLSLETRLKELSKIQDDATALAKVFGTENLVAGQILLQNTDKVSAYTEAVTGKNTAIEQAAINSATLSNLLEEMKNKWTNLVTSSSQAGSTLDKVKKVVVFLTDNMETLIKVGVGVIGFFVTWKAAIWASRAALFAYNIAMGVYNALTGKSALLTVGNTVAYKAFRVAVWLSNVAQKAYNLSVGFFNKLSLRQRLATIASTAAMIAGKVATAAFTAAQWLLNVALNANPIGLVVLAIAALVGIITLVVKKYDEWGAALTFVLGPLGMIINAVMIFRRNWDKITEAFSKGGILAGLKMIGATLLDMILYPLQQILELIAMIPGLGIADSLAKDLEKFRAGMGVVVETDGPEEGEEVTPALDKSVAEQKMVSESIINKQQTIDLNINDPGQNANFTSQGDDIVMPKVMPTFNAPA